MQRPSDISLCMIVRNEAENIAQCLRSVQNLVSQIVVVDTGSTDGTDEICLKMGAELHPFCWIDDFSAARNYGLEKATGKWILWMDADEELIVQDPDRFLQTVAAENTSLIPVMMIHYYGCQPPDPSRSYRSASHRLFRREAGLRFIGRIHEHLEWNSLQTSHSENTIQDAMIHHYGYMDNAVKEKGKSNRNMELLLLEQQHAPSPWISYHLAAELYRMQEYQEAYEKTNDSIRRFLEQNQLPPALVYKLKYEIVLNHGDASDALPGIEKALILYPGYVDLHYYRGLLLFLQERYAEAEDCFLRCLQLGDEDPNYLILTGTGSFYSRFYLKKCQKALNDG